MTPSPKVVPPEEKGGLFAGWNRFWFAPTDAFGLHLVRVATGVLLLAWLLPLAGQVEPLFGLQGWFDHQAFVEARRLDPMSVPKPIARDNWSLLYLAGKSGAALQAMYWGSIAVLALFTLGIATRLTAPAAWVVVVSFTATPLFDEEVDPVLHMLTLYLAVGYLLLGQWSWRQSLFGRLFGSSDGMLFSRLLRKAPPAPPSVGANLALRLLQVHFAVLVVTTGLTKLQIGEWWSGVPHWYNIFSPMTATMERIRQVAPDPPWFFAQLNVLAYATLAWQIFFPTFAWRGGWCRLLLLGGAVAGWLGLALLYKLPLFGPAFAIGCMAYISGREWGLLGQALQRVSPLRRLGEVLPDVPDPTWSASRAGSLQATRER
ncbi:MAG: hypothetical protein U0797_28360 [Gemmataceae bacterium]